MNWFIAWVCSKAMVQVCVSAHYAVCTVIKLSGGIKLTKYPHHFNRVCLYIIDSELWLCWLLVEQGQEEKRKEMTFGLV